VPKYVSFIRVVHNAASNGVANDQLIRMEHAILAKPGTGAALAVTINGLRRGKKVKIWSLKIVDFIPKMFTPGVVGVEEKA
jgi:hypothetical protein